MTSDIKNTILFLQHIAPDAHGTGAHNGTTVDMSDVTSGCFVVNVGTVGSSGTIDAKLQYSANGSSGWTDETSGRANDTAITQMTASGTAFLRVNSPRERYYRVVMTVGVAASDAAVDFIGDPLNKPQH